MRTDPVLAWIDSVTGAAGTVARVGLLRTGRKAADKVVASAGIKANAVRDLTGALRFENWGSCLQDGLLFIRRNSAFMRVR